MSAKKGIPKRPFTAAEDAAIRAGYARRRVGRLADRIGRSVEAVYRRAKVLGLKLRHGDRPTKGTPQLAARAAGLADAGHGLKEIARRLGVSTPTVRDALARIGRRVDGRSTPLAKERCAAAMAARTARGEKMVDARWVARSPARPYNLPPLSAEGLQVLLALLGGPLTKRELCAAVGRPWLGPKKSLRTHHGMTFTHNLKNLGLVACACRGLGRGTGKGTGKEYRYSLTPKALDALASAGKDGA